jgi:hypothetical protein
MIISTNMNRYLKSALPLFIPAASLLAQSGSLGTVTSQFQTMGTSIIHLLVILAGFTSVGLIVFGGLMLGTNPRRGGMMLIGGLCGALILGLSYLIVNGLTGQSIS